MTTTRAPVHPPAQPPATVAPVSVAFWLVRILCSTLGERTAGLLAQRLGLGLTYTTSLAAGLVVVTLALQLAVRRYVPAVYWAVVLLLAVAGDLVVVDLAGLGVPVPVTALLLAVALAALLDVWRRDRSLAPDATVARNGAGSYWAAAALACTVGSATGDLLAGLAGLHHVVAVVAAGAVAVLGLVWWRWRGGAPAFWVAFALTGPLGDALDGLADAPRRQGGLGWGAGATSLVLLAALVALVACLSVSRRAASSAAG